MVTANPTQRNGHIITPNGSYPVCPSDYESAPALKPESPGWRDHEPRFVHSIKWHDTADIEHMHVSRADDLDEVLREVRMVKAFISAARVKEHEASNIESEPVTETASDDDHDMVWCDHHHVAMRRREKNGHAWYSHRLANGKWCTGKKG